MKKFSTTFVWMAVIFCVCLTTSNIFVPRTWQVWGLPLQLSAAVILFPVSYIINDVLTEVYGYRKARIVIWMGFAMSFFVALMGSLACLLPAPMYEDGLPVMASFDMLFRSVPKTVLASLLAFLCGSTFNAFIMSRMKVRHEGRRFGLRAIVSSLGGETVDSLVFFPIVFWGQMDAVGIINIMFTQVVVKTLYELAVLPLTSVVVRRVKAHEGEDTFDKGISYNPFRLGDI